MTDQLQLQIAFIAAGAAIVASLGAQIISAVVVAVTATREFNWRRQQAADDAAAAASAAAAADLRWTVDRQAAEIARFETVKREVFVEYLSAVLEFAAVIDDRQSRPLLSALSPSISRRQIDALSRHGGASIQIRLVAPEVHAETFAVGEAVLAAYAAVRARRVAEIDTERQILVPLRVARRAMQRSLGIRPEDEPDGAVSPSTI